MNTSHPSSREREGDDQNHFSSALQVERRALADLKSPARQLRKNDHAVQRMAALLKKWGCKIPILILSTGEVVDGNLRVKAAKVLGWSDIPVIVCDGWTDAQVRAFRLAVNKSATWAEFDLEMVALEMSELQALEFDLAFTGFDSLEIDRLLFKKHDDPDAGLDGSGDSKTVTKMGNVWLCCGHKVRCGDATSPEDVRLLLGSAQPALMVIDPSYGVDYEPHWREEAGLGHLRQTGGIANDHRCDWTAAYKLFTGDVAYVWHAGVHAAVVAQGLEAAGFKIRAQIIWVKQHFALSRGDYHWQHEPCWYAVREGKSSHWSGDRTQSTVWGIANLNPFGGNREEEVTGHSTQKPLEAMRRPILNNTRRGEIVYDPFIGSGTTLIAAELTDRICYGMDIEPRYVDMTVKRWQKQTGKQAVLEGDGRTFDEVAAGCPAPDAEAPECRDQN
jgi:DNA modification methylase